MRVVITCGPSYEPIDEVRRITNFSTGELGALLGQLCAVRGFETFCWMGEAATWPRPGFCRPFSTNADLLAKLHAIKHPETIDYVFHAAALSDFKVTAVRDSAGVSLKDCKIPSRGGNLTLELEPAIKVIGHLRALFPRAWIAGWKYELQGTREEAVARGLRQITENGTNASFVNGKAYGTGFGHVEHGGLVRHFPDKASLCAGILAEKEGKPFTLPAVGHLD